MREDVKGDRALVPGVRLNGRRDDKGDMERERWVERGGGG